MLKINPNIEKINLSILQIESINDLIFELFHFQNLKEIDLSCNRIKQLPKDLSILSQVERIDLSNNLFLDIEAVLFSLNTMPKLKELNITYDASQLKHTLNFYLPKVQVVNGEIIKSGGEPVLKNPIVQVKNGKIDILRARSSQKLLNHGYLFYDEELTLIRNFQQNIQTHVNEDIGNPSQQSIEFTESLKKMNDQVKKAYDYNNQIMEKCYEGIYQKNQDTIFPKIEYLKNLRNCLLNFMKHKNPKLVKAIDNLFNVYEIFIDNIDKQSKYLDQPIFGAKVQQSIKEIEHKNEIKTSSNQQQKNQNSNFSNAERTLLKMKINELEKENKELKTENDHVYKTLVDNSRETVNKLKEKLAKESGIKLNTTKSLTKKEKTKEITIKDLSKKQMLELIQDIMKVKKSNDERNLTAKSPPETLENFLYVYFSQKYGLKEMVNTSVSSLISNLKNYSSDFIEIQTFQQILKNQVDEKFFWFLQDVKTKVQERLANYFRSKIRKNGSLVDMNNFVSEKVAKGISNTEGKWILSQSYSGRELKQLEGKFQIIFDENSKKAEKENLLEFQLFLEFLFAFELEKHLQYLKIVSDFFNTQDHNHDGVITKKQFLNLMDIFVQRNINCNLEQIVKDVDPQNFDAITFSKTIEILSGNFADLEKKQNLIDSLNSIQVYQNLNKYGNFMWK